MEPGDLPMCLYFCQSCLSKLRCPIQTGSNASVAAVIRRILNEEYNVGVGEADTADNNPQMTPISMSGTAADDPQLDSLYEFYSSRKRTAYYTVQSSDLRVIGCGGIGTLRIIAILLFRHSQPQL